MKTMITFKHFLSESVQNPLMEHKFGQLYKAVSIKTSAGLKSNKAMPVKHKFTSFVSDKKYLKLAEFGPSIIMCDTKDLPKNVSVIEIQYDLAWFTRSPLHRELLLMVTSRDEEDWLEEFNGDSEAVDNEIEALYGDEHEVVVVGLKNLDPQIFHVVK